MMGCKLEFKPHYYADRLLRINPYGRVGVVTLWSKPTFVRDQFEAEGIDLGTNTSAVAAFGTFYGGGLRELLRNLLLNPQIDTLLVVGRNRRGSYELLHSFFKWGIRPVAADFVYQVDDSEVKIGVCEVVGLDRSYYVDDVVRPEMFSPPPIIVRIEGNDGEAFSRCKTFFDEFEPRPTLLLRRRHAELPSIGVSTYPSDPQDHTIRATTPLDAWRQVAHRAVRFGVRVQLRRKVRLELQNVRVLITEPSVEKDDELIAAGFDPKAFKEYMQIMLNPGCDVDQAYAYGHRIRAYFGEDLLIKVVKELRVEVSQGDVVDANHDGRKAYITLWDNEKDGISDSPCLVSLFFRKIEERIHLTATYRSHNVNEAWLANVYGLISILRVVAETAGARVGTLTVISHSLGLNPSRLGNAIQAHARVSRQNVFREDPRGSFIISVEKGEIVLTHQNDGVVLGTYRGKSPEGIRHRLARDLAVSDINHAMYIGQQLERAYWCIKAGIEYQQVDKFEVPTLL